MSESARVESVDALRSFRAALLKFAETANTALTDAESDIFRTINWLETEQRSYWRNQLRARTEALSRAKEALRMKTIFKDASGRTPNAMEEEKALRTAQARLEEAQTKIVAVQKYARLLQREMQMYKGSVQRLAGDLTREIPAAAAAMGNWIESLQGYVDLAPRDDAPLTQPDENRTNQQDN